MGKTTTTKGKKVENESDGRQDGGLASDLLASSGPPHGDSSNPAVSLADIQKVLAGMEEQIIANLKAQISSNHTTIARHDQTIQAIETSMNDFQGRITTLESTMGNLIKENEQLKLKVDDLENRSRSCNIRITGIPEKAEGTQPTSFIESCLREIFCANALPH